MKDNRRHVVSIIRVGEHGAILVPEEDVEGVSEFLDQLAATVVKREVAITNADADDHIDHTFELIVVMGDLDALQARLDALAT